jgi:hypothetical protein
MYLDGWVSSGLEGFGDDPLVDGQIEGRHLFDQARRGRFLLLVFELCVIGRSVNISDEHVCRVSCVSCRVVCVVRVVRVVSCRAEDVRQGRQE